MGLKSRDDEELSPKSSRTFLPRCFSSLVDTLKGRQVEEEGRAPRRRQRRSRELLGEDHENCSNRNCACDGGARVWLSHRQWLESKYFGGDAPNQAKTVKSATCRLTNDKGTWPLHLRALGPGGDKMPGETK